MSRIGSLLGVPLYADDCTTNQSRVPFARLLVEVDVTKPLVDKVWLEDGNGVEFQQVVKFEWKPPYCNKCHAVGHDCGKKAKGVGKVQPKKVWVPKQKPSADVPIDTPTVPCA